LWAFVEKKSEMKGKCHDGKEVESTQIYKVSEFKATAATSLRSAHKIKECLADHQSIHAFKASSVKLNLEQRLVPLLQSQMGDTLSSERKEVLKRAIGILFSFQRQRLVDAGAFVKDTRYWLEQA